MKKLRNLRKNLMKAYETDASKFKGKAKAVYHPKSILEVKEIVKIEKQIVPRGAGSGLSGGSIPMGGADSVIDLSKLNSIGSLDMMRKTIEVDAGVVLDDLQNYLRPNRLNFPIIPISHSVATIGGMIATNATGNRGSRVGRMINWIQWIEIIDDEGRLIRKGATEISDFCGLEGITGIIVRACLKLAPLRLHTASILKLETIEEVILVTRKLKRDSSVSSIELFDKKISSWLGLEKGYNMLIEYEDNSGMLKGKEYFDSIKLIERAYLEAYSRDFSRIEDPKILVDRMDRLVEWLEGRGIPYFGHLSNGIIHPCFNLIFEKEIPEMVSLIKKLGGQVSGSFGIGILKKGFVEINDKKILENVKKRTDPLNKFNRGKVI